jgi:hypothetical protein
MSIINDYASGFGPGASGLARHIVQRRRRGLG